MNETLPPMKSFVLPGGHTTVSYCHIARCVCRRTERLTVELNDNEYVNDAMQKIKIDDFYFEKNSNR